MTDNDAGVDAYTHPVTAAIPASHRRRFSTQSIVMLAITLVAIIVVVTTVHVDQIVDALRHANNWWVLVAFGFSILPWYGTALAMASFAPGNLPMTRMTLAQVASSFVSVAAPAGVGHAGTNLRFMQKRGIPLPQAIAGAALSQVSQFLVTLLGLVILMAMFGTHGLIDRPSRRIVYIILAVITAIIITVCIPRLRRWVWAKAKPTIAEIRPRLTEMLTQPKRLAAGVTGNLIVVITYVLTFYSSMQAFGHTLPLVDVAIIFLVGNSVGALVPTPGGIGGVEGALIFGLTAAGLPAAIAFSVTMLFRIVTYWIEIPIGWFAMHYLQRRGDL
jgi:uncharacterized protein (TIRG00374 family)